MSNSQLCWKIIIENKLQVKIVIKRFTFGADRQTDNILLLEVRGEVSAVRCSVLQYTVLDIALKPGSEWHKV